MNIVATIELSVVSGSFMLVEADNQDMETSPIAVILLMSMGSGRAAFGNLELLVRLIILLMLVLSMPATI